ncbi:MAG: hypothetical protein HUJ98_04755 [Bacteroidaceae bacterium]|nr:hypothetical protein [Bacteroidaceae bacterium]
MKDLFGEYERGQSTRLQSEDGKTRKCLQLIIKIPAGSHSSDDLRAFIDFANSRGYSCEVIKPTVDEYRIIDDRTKSWMKSVLDDVSADLTKKTIDDEGMPPKKARTLVAYIIWTCMNVAHFTVACSKSNAPRKARIPAAVVAKILGVGRNTLERASKTYRKLNDKQQHIYDKIKVKVDNF